MGSRRRWLLAGVALVVVSCAAAASAPARPTDDGREVASRFLRALVSGDSSTACGLLSTNALASLGGTARCERSLRGYAAYSVQDFASLRALYEAHEAAEESARARGGSYVTKRFGLRALARAIERAAPALTVKLGRGPTAAAGQLDTTVVLDQRTSARRLVLYSEADDGSIWRLSAPACGQGEFEEVAQGIPESQPPDPASLVDVTSLTPLDEGRVLVRAQLKLLTIAEAGGFGVALVLVPSQGSYLVDDMLFSTLSGGFEDTGAQAFRSLAGAPQALLRAVAAQPAG